MRCPEKSGSAVVLLLALVTSSVSAVEPKRHLVGFSWETLSEMSPQSVEWLNKGALTGGAVSYIQSYSFQRGPTVEDSAERLEFFRNNCRKDIWPTLFLAQITGFNPSEAHVSSKSRKGMEVYKAFTGMDFDNKFGTRKVFEANWVEALRISKAMGWPGIMFDPEMYNDYRNESLARNDPRGTGKKRPGLAELTGITVEEARLKCRELGTRLADLAHETYPAATIWFFYTRLQQTNRNDVTEALVTLGMLQRCKDRGYALRIIDGGEGGHGYLHPSAEEVAHVIRNRYILAKPVLIEYPNFELGGVSAPFVDAKHRANWFVESKIGNMMNIEDHKPIFVECFRNYRTTWLYGASYSYYPFGPDTPRVSKVLAAAMAKTKYATVNLAALPDEPIAMPESLKVKLTGNVLGIPSVHKTPAVGKELYIDLTDPDATGIPLANAAEYPKRGKAKLVLVSKDEDARYRAELRLSDWVTGSHQWPGVETSDFLVSDLTPYSGIAVDVRNVGSHEGEIGWEIGEAGHPRTWYTYYRLAPGDEYTMAVSTQTLGDRMNLENIRFFKLITRRPPNALQFQLGPVVLIRKDADQD